MGRTDNNLETFGPEPNYGTGAEMVHYLVHGSAIGKTIAAVYLGDNERFRALVPEDFPPDGIFRSEFLAFEFTDGSNLVLQVAAGNSFHLALCDEADKILRRAKRNARKRKKAAAGV